MILEGLVTTVDEQGGMHLAPMGPTVAGPDVTALLFRPFPTSKTGQNLLRSREGIFHVTDDVGLIARATLGLPIDSPTTPAHSIHGFVLSSCVRAYEFCIRSSDTSAERFQLHAEVVHVHRLHDWVGFNRAKHAVLEAAILASRFHLIAPDEIDREFDRLRTIVSKTAGPDEQQAFALLDDARSRR